MATTPAIEAEVEARLGRLSLEQKVRLLTGADTWTLHEEPDAGLGRTVLSDGPSGVRGTVWDERDPSVNLPSATALAATWDPEVAYRYGAALAGEAHRKGVHVVLGPTINLHRSPLGGRHFEAFSEDPELTSVLAEAYVRGLQDHGIGACAKHYVANDFETERFTASVTVPERALRELYLAPFERAVRAGTWTVMSAYNAIDGVTMTEHDLLASPLCDEWGFDGVVVSDWGAVRSLQAARARQDLAMPGPDSGWSAGLVDAVRDGQIPISAIDEKVRRILRLAARVGTLDGVAPPAGSAAAVNPVALAREVAARGTVCVRNDGILPFSAPRSIAVLGQNAEVARTQGGGSATVVPERVVSPLDAIRAAFPDAQITHEMGAATHDEILALPLHTVTDPETGEPGLRARFLGADGTVVLSESRRTADLVWLGNAPRDGVAVLELLTDYRPERTEALDLGVKAVGRTVIELDGTVVLDEDAELEGRDLGAALLDPPTRVVRVELDGGRPVRLRVTHHLDEGGPRPPGLAAITLGVRPVAESAETLIERAVAAARDAEVVVVVVGTSAQVESEGFDRGSLALPGHQDALVHAVAAANPRTVVVVNSGSPVLMPWRHEVAAILLTWFGGQEYGHALTDVLSGAVEPGGRLPTTWPGTHADVPVLDVTPTDGVLRYDEGIHIGYRAWHRLGRVPAYPFGFGMGYTTWSYDAVRTTGAAEGVVVVDVEVTNTGDRAGREVVQVYLVRTQSEIERPARWLAGSAVVGAAAGETVTAQVVIPARAFEHWDVTRQAWAAEPGSFEVVVARHADATELVATVER